MNILDLLEGCTILASYHPGNDDYWNVAAEHDEMWLPGLPPEEMKPKDVERLEELLFDWAPEYDSWRHYT